VLSTLFTINSKHFLNSKLRKRSGERRGKEKGDGKMGRVGKGEEKKIIMRTQILDSWFRTHFLFFLYRSLPEFVKKKEVKGRKGKGKTRETKEKYFQVLYILFDV
jgi:hypothetical protein